MSDDPAALRLPFDSEVTITLECDSTGRYTDDEWRAINTARLAEAYPDYSIRYVWTRWEPIANGFWRRLFRRPERGRWVTGESL